MLFQSHFTPLVLSNIAGWISISSWIIVYTPQIFENWQLKSGEGLSVSFIILWLAGDLTGLVGAMMAGLLPTMIILAVYYTICDIVLLFQVYYYRRYHAELAAKGEVHGQSTSAAATTGANEATPLLPASPSTQPKPLLPSYVMYPLLLVFILCSGVLGWYLSPLDNNDEISIPEQPGKGPNVELEWKSQTLGYASAVLYIGSRVPQIAHNTRTRCAGLSLAMFFFSITGNVTYMISIMVTSLEPRYLLANLSWILGSSLTVFLDLFVLAQFAVFSYQDKKRAQEGKPVGRYVDEESSDDSD